MGCGPSKDANVATGNTVKPKSLLKNNASESSNATSSRSSTETDAATTNITDDTNTVIENVVDEEEVEGKASEDVKVKDVVQSAVTASSEEGKFIAAGSPDHYFSSRKDEEEVAGLTSLVGPVPAIVDGETVEVFLAAAANVEEVQVEKVNGEEDGKPSRSKTDSADFKEVISAVEENAFEVEPTENKNASMAASS